MGMMEAKGERRMFDILAKAGAGALYRLLSKLPVEEAAIVLTNLPNQLAIQVIAYYPGETQAEIGPAMVDARWAEPEKIEQTEAKIRAMLQQAKQNLAAKNGAPAAPPPSPPEPDGRSGTPAATPQRRLVERKRPGSPVARPSSPQFGKAGNPYQTAAESAPKAPPQDKQDESAGKPTLAGRARELAKNMLRPPTAKDKRKSEAPSSSKPPQPPQPWIPRQATGSPINGPALPGTPPPVAGDPFASPLAKAGLLDLIGRAQEKLLPKNAQQQAQPIPPRGTPPAKPRARAGGDKREPGRPEPLEGLLAPDSVRLAKTPRLIGPGAPKREPPAAPAGGGKAGARRMDGKAILAAILREAGPSVRGTVRRDDPALFKQLRDRMFYFDDLALTEDNALARVFTAAPTEESALALKFAAPALREKVFRAVSPGRARALREHAAARAGLDEVDRAQQTVLDVALQLQSAGRILIDPRDPDLAGK